MTPSEFVQARLTLGLSIEGLSDLIGVSFSTVWRWETGAVPVPQYAALILDLLLQVQGTTLATRYGLD